MSQDQLLAIFNGGDPADAILEDTPNAQSGDGETSAAETEELS